MLVAYERITFPRTQALTTTARVTQETGSSVSHLQRLIDRASGEIVGKVGRDIARSQVREKWRGMGMLDRRLRLYPIAELVALSLDGAAQDLAEIELHAGGVVFNSRVFCQTARSLWSADYWGGYLLPSEDLEAVTFISALASDNSFNLSGTNKWPYVRAGDWFQVSGFAATGNNGAFKVTERTSDVKVKVAGTLTNEGPGSPIPTVTVKVSTLPPALERACVLLVTTALDLSSVAGGGLFKSSESIGDYSVAFSEFSSGKGLAAELVQPYTQLS